MPDDEMEMTDRDRILLLLSDPMITEEQLYELLAPWVDLHGPEGMARLLRTYADRMDNSARAPFVGEKYRKAARILAPEEE